MKRKSLPTYSGAGQMRFVGHRGPAEYAIEGDPSRLRAGPSRLRGSFRTTPEIAALAFRAGDGILSLEDGAELRVLMLGHTAGSPDVFIELRI